MAKKEFMYRGYDLEALKRMSIDEFTELVDSRMRRTLKRGFSPLQKKLIEKIRNAKQGVMIKTHARDTIILPAFVGKTLGVHNGNTFQRVEVQPEMVGHYMGEFAQTRKKIAHSAPGVGATRASKYVSLK